MQTTSLFRRALPVLFLTLLMMTEIGRAATPTNVVISQIYGAGGNSGAVLNADYVELFNPTAGTLTLSNYSLQYSSAAGTTISTITVLPSTITLAPGQYYLVAANAGTNGAALPVTPDYPTGAATSNLALAAGSGKIALVSTTTKLASVCPATDPTIVDFVAYGTGTNCAYGTAAPLIGTTLADIRTNPCVVLGNSGTEFVAGTPAPHNSASTPLSCSTTTSTPPVASGLATPSAINTGGSTLLTVQVTPGTVPVSTGIAVSANLSAIGGSSTQPFFDDGTNGDVTAGDNVFSYSTTVITAGTFSLPVTVTDTQARTASATIALTATTPPAFVTIRTIQANKPSTYATQRVTTSGIVVGVKSNGFYLEAKDADVAPVTPEGILVYTGATAIPSYVVLGAEVQVSGTVNTYPTTSLTPGTEIDGPQTFSLLSTGKALPTPVTITAAQDSPSGGIKQFARYEGMRVAIASMTTTSGTDATLTEMTETNVSNGRFYGVVTGVARPFREPGIAVTDTAIGTVPSTIPVWDSNPELIYVDSLATGGPAIDVTSNATVTGLSGVMDFSFGAPELILDQANRPTVTGLMTAAAVPAQAATEFTVATFNMERFYNDIVDADNPGSTAVTVTTAAYQRRLAKASMAIRNVLNFPDIVGAQEIENINVLTDLANRISADAVAAGQNDPAYKPYTFLATDGTAINTAVLVKSTRVTTVNVQQFGLATTFTSSTGAQAVLNDRTPLVLHAGIKRGSGLPDYPVTVIVVHQRSLINVDDPTSTGQTVRLKREAQAEYLASLIQSYQAAGEHVITVGDFNAFEFSDGFVDSLGVTTGNPVPAAQVLTAPKTGLVSPTLVDLVTLLPAAQRQSYVEDGSAQVLDHVVVTQDLVPTETRLVYAHMDSDYPLVYQNDATRPERVSDHDPAVAYFTVPAAPAAFSLSTNSLNFGTQLVTAASGAMTVTLTNTGGIPLAVSGIATTGSAYAQTNTCGTTVAAAGTCQISVIFTPATAAAAVGTVNIATNAPGSPTLISLAGSGGDYIVASTAPSQRVTGGGAATFPILVSSIDGLSATITLGCTGASTGETCTGTTVTLPPGGTATGSVTVQTTSQLVAQNVPARGGSGDLQIAGFLLGGLGLLGFGKILRLGSVRRYGRLLTLLGVIAIAGCVTGCNNGPGTKSGTPLGAQSLTLTATSGGVTRTVVVTLTVQ